jgi:hypothetical protein
MRANCGLRYLVSNRAHELQSQFENKFWAVVFVESFAPWLPTVSPGNLSTCLVVVVLCIELTDRTLEFSLRSIGI